MGKGRVGGRGELGAPRGVTLLPPARWGDTLDLAGRGGSFGEGVLYFKQGSIPSNAEASSSLGCRVSVRENVMGFLLIFCIQQSFSDFALQSPKQRFSGSRNAGTSWGPHPVAPCIRTPSCSCNLLRKAARVVVKNNRNPK